MSICCQCCLTWYFTRKKNPDKKCLNGKCCQKVKENFLAGTVAIMLILCSSIDYVLYTRLSKKLQMFALIFSQLIYPIAFCVLIWPVVLIRYKCCRSLMYDRRSYRKLEKNNSRDDDATKFSKDLLLKPDNRDNNDDDDNRNNDRCCKSKNIRSACNFPWKVFLVMAIVDAVTGLLMMTILRKLATTNIR